MAVGLALAGCAAAPPAVLSPDTRLPIASQLGSVRDDIVHGTGMKEAPVRSGLADPSKESVLFKPPVVMQTLADPWRGIAQLEQRLLRVSVAPLRDRPVPELLTALYDLPDRPAVLGALPAPPTSAKPDDHLAYLETVLVEADKLRARALEGLNESERQFLFDHAALLAEQFVPQLSEQNEDQQFRARMNNRFFTLTAERLDETALLAAAQLVASLADDAWLRAAQAAFARLPPAPSLPWVTGTVVLTKETPAGWIVIGGPGPNTYRETDQRVALLLDLGGDDTYAGFAVPVNVSQGISAVIDLAGNDVYETGPLGLATGRLGVGMLLDRAGDDRYRFASGTGGAGFAGIGLLVDGAGNDQYEGARFTQGAAIGGIGLLLDRSGDDRQTGFGYAIGFGGPRGVGAVIDLAGHDAYECGRRYASGYNEAETPAAKAGEPGFQYDCFGLGAGAGQRLLPKADPTVLDDVGGGIGLVLDQQGNDRYVGANFSQGLGYYFGAGILWDERGDDDYTAARYGLGAAAHYGVGFLADRDGSDRYGSTGPFYTLAAAWDRSVAAAFDDGTADDRYELQKSTGLGIADHHAWSLLLDAGGRDRYAVPTGLGTALHGSLSGFVDLGGNDRYETTLPVRQGAILRREESGGLFVDR
jgi:hypothetical protein